MVQSIPHRPVEVAIAHLSVKTTLAISFYLRQGWVSLLYHGTTGSAQPGRIVAPGRPARGSRAALSPGAGADPAKFPTAIPPGAAALPAAAVRRRTGGNHSRAGDQSRGRRSPGIERRAAGSRGTEAGSIGELRFRTGFEAGFCRRALQSCSGSDP